MALESDGQWFDGMASRSRSSTMHAVDFIKPATLSSSSSSSAQLPPQLLPTAPSEPPCAPVKGGGAVGAKVGEKKELEEQADDLPPPPPLPEKKRDRKTHPRSFYFGPHLVTFRPPRSWQASCGRSSCAHQAVGRPGTRCTRTLSFRGEDEGLKNIEAMTASMLRSFCLNTFALSLRPGSHYIVNFRRNQLM